MLTLTYHMQGSTIGFCKGSFKLFNQYLFVWTCSHLPKMGFPFLNKILKLHILLKWIIVMYLCYHL